MEYINYYIAALAESKVAFIQNSLKIRSPNSSIGMNPQPSNSSEIYSSVEPVCQNLSVRFVLATPDPMSIALWKLDASWIYAKGTYKARVSYVF